MRPIDYLAVAQPPWECKLPWGQRSLTALQHFPHCWASPIAPTTRRIGNSLNTDCNPTVERKLQSPTVMFPANHFSMSHQSTLPLMRRLPRSVRLPQPRNQLICPAPILYPFCSQNLCSNANFHDDIIGSRLILSIAPLSCPQTRQRCRINVLPT